MRIQTLVILTALLAGAVLSAQAYTLTFQDSAGDVRLYKTELSLTGNASSLGLNAPVDAKVVKVTQEKVTAVNDGKASITTTLKEGKITATVSGLPGEDAQTLEQPLPDFTLAYARTPQGKVSDLKITGALPVVLGGPADSVLNTGLYAGQGMAFPTTELKIGDTWSGKESVPVNGGKAIEAKVDYTLTGTKVIDGKTFLLITGEVDTTVPALTMKLAALGDMEITVAMTLKGKVTTLFDPKAGAIAREVYDLTSAVTMGGGEDNITATMNLTIKGTMTRVK